MSTFKVGKKYRAKGFKGLGPLIFTCVHIEHGRAIFEHSQGRSHSESLLEPSSPYVEYVEPLKGYVNVWKTCTGKVVLGYTVYETRENAAAVASGYSGNTLLKTIEVSYVPEN